MIEAKNDHVVVETMTRQRTAGGLILPEVAVEPQAYGRVTSVGEEVKYFKKGDIVIHHSNGGMAVVFDNKMLRVLKENEVYGILTDESFLSTLDKCLLRK
jgi:co-chaperonin GroES (HSP10)